MFRVPSFVRDELFKNRVCYTTRYKYVLVDATDIMSGLYFCDRYPLVSTGVPGVRAPQLEAIERVLL